MGGADSKQRRLVEHPADDLHSERQPVFRKSGGDGERGIARDIEGDRLRCRGGFRWRPIGGEIRQSGWRGQRAGSHQRVVPAEDLRVDCGCELGADAKRLHPVGVPDGCAWNDALIRALVARTRLEIMRGWQCLGHHNVPQALNNSKCGSATSSTIALLFATIAAPVNRRVTSGETSSASAKPGEVCDLQAGEICPMPAYRTAPAPHAARTADQQRSTGHKRAILSGPSQRPAVIERIR